MASPDLEAIEKRWQAATKGPYHTDETSCVFSPDDLIAEIERKYDGDGSREGNAEFIAHSWQDIKDLLEVAKQKQETANYQAEGIISQEWQGSDNYGHWQTFVRAANNDDIIREAYEKFNQGLDSADYEERKVRVTIELIES